MRYNALIAMDASESQVGYSRPCYVTTYSATLIIVGTLVSHSAQVVR